MPSVRKLLVNVVDRVALLSDLYLVFIDPFARGLFFSDNAIDVGAAVRQFPLQQFELFSGMMRIQNLQIRVERLISSRLTGLALQRTDLSFDLFNDIADAEKVCFSGLE